MNIYEELTARGLIADCTDKDELVKRLASAPMTLYCGFDPTADSLHIGSLVPLLALRRFQLCGHHPIALAGGATGSIGDPSGKSAERVLLTREVIDANIACGLSQQPHELPLGRFQRAVGHVVDETNEDRSSACARRARRGVGGPSGSGMRFNLQRHNISLIWQHLL